MKDPNALYIDNITWFVGIDISKACLDVHLRPAGHSFRCDNNAEGFGALDAWLRTHGATPKTTIVCMEQTGVYGKQLVAALTEAGWQCAVEHTTITRKVGADHHRKDDAYDAALVSEYAERFLDILQLSQPTEASVDELRRLYTERVRLVTYRAATKSKQTQAKHEVVESPLCIELWQHQIDFYDDHIAQIQAQIETLISNHEGLQAYYDLVVSIPGMGPVTAWLWLILFYGEDQLNHKKVASRFGFAPHSHMSGSSVRGKTRSSGHGLSEMRAKMTMVVRSSSTHVQKFQEYKQRKEEEGKMWPVIRNNLINKYIKITCAIWNNKTPYDPNHTSRFHRQKKAKAA